MTHYGRYTNCIDLICSKNMRERSGPSTKIGAISSTGADVTILILGAATISCSLSFVRERTSF